MEPHLSRFVSELGLKVLGFSPDPLVPVREPGQMGLMNRDKWAFFYLCMEDVMAAPNPGVMLENAREWITASRTTVTGGGSSHCHVDAVMLYFLSVK